MKKLFLSICALALFAFANAQTVDRSIQPKSGPAPKINLKQPATFTLPNGLKVFVVENHKMPIVTYSIQLDIHAKTHPKKVGLQGFVGSLLTLGTTDKSKDEFNADVDQIGASIDASGSGIGGATLTKYQDKFLNLLSDALLHPAFSQKQLDKLVKRAKSGLIANENDADFMLSNVAGVVNYGKSHPYGEVETYQTIQNITIPDVKKYYNTYFRPNVAYMAVIGDITPAKAKELVTKYFGSWQKAQVPEAVYPKVTIPQQRTVAFAKRAGAVQSVIAVTYPVHLKVGVPDVIKARAMNQILGGGSTGRLFQNLRENHGWTYGAYSSISSDEIIGNVRLYAKCRNAVTDSSITAMLQEMDSIKNYPVDSKTLQDVKNSMSGKFALSLESAGTIAAHAINIEKYNLPKDYYKNYIKNVDAVTVKDVQNMAKKYIKPLKTHVVVVGNPSQVKNLKKFSTSGKINFYNAFGESVQPTINKEVNGKHIDDILNHYINAIGGKEALKSLTSLTEYADRKIKDLTIGKVTVLISSPDKYLQRFVQVDPRRAMANASPEMKEKIEKMLGAPSFNARKIVVNGDKGFQEVKRKKHEFSKEQLRPYKAKADLQSILHPEKYGINYALLKMDNVNGSPAYVVSKASNNGKKKSLLYFDAKTGLLVKSIGKESYGTKSILTTRFYSDYKEVRNGNGYKIPFTIKMITPQGVQFVKYRYAKANSNIKAKKFK